MNKQQIEKLQAEKDKLTDPFDKIVFDNQWIDGLPVGLILMAHEEKKEVKKPCPMCQDENKDRCRLCLRKKKEQGKI